MKIMLPKPPSCRLGLSLSSSSLLIMRGFWEPYSVLLIKPLQKKIRSHKPDLVRGAQARRWILGPRSDQQSAAPGVGFVMRLFQSASGRCERLKGCRSDKMFQALASNGMMVCLLDRNRRATPRVVFSHPPHAGYCVRAFGHPDTKLNVDVSPMPSIMSSLRVYRGCAQALLFIVSWSV